MGKKKYALLLSVLLSGCYGGSSNGLPPHNPTHETLQVTSHELQQESDQIAEAKKLIRKQEQNQVVKMGSHQYWDVPLSRDLQDYIQTKCGQYGISEQFVYAVMKQESRFDPNMISETNDYGLMGINVANFSTLRSELGITNFLDPYQNSLAGIYLLGNLKKKYVYENIVLMSYNGGDGYMKNLTSRGVFTTDYYYKVEENKSQLHKKD